MVAAALSPLVATAGVVVVASPTNAAVTVGTNITAFPNRDMVGAFGYTLGEELTIEVERNGVVIGTTTGRAMETLEGTGLEVNHGVEGTPAPGECWTNYTPDIVPGDLIRVITAGGTDTTTVKNVDIVGDPYLDANNNVALDGTGNAGEIAVEFRRDKPTPRFRREGIRIASTGTNTWTATFVPSTGTSAEGLTTEQQRSIALNEASWAAIIGGEGSEVTISEHGEVNGVADGCTGSSEPNAVAGGYTQPINIASGNVELSGTARQTVNNVSITVGSLPAKNATLSTNTVGEKTWSVTFTKAELETLPDGNLTVTSSFDGLAGANRTILKDMVAPAVPTATPAPGTYSATQNVALLKPAGEAQSKVYWEIGPATGPNPTENSTLYSSQIAVSATQTIKAITVDPAGNRSTVASFAYTIGAPQQQRPDAPTIGSAAAADRQVTVNWSAPSVTGSSAITSYQVQARTGTTQVGNLVTVGANARSAVVPGLTNGTAYNFRVRAVNAAGASVYSGTVSATPRAAAVALPGRTMIGTAAPGAVGGTVTATAKWAPPTSGGAVTGYVVRALRMSSTGAVLSTKVSPVQPATARQLAMTLPAGKYRFTVQARNSAGSGTPSARSNLVTAR